MHILFSLWHSIQQSLFPHLEKELDPHLSKTAKIKKFAVDFKGFTAQEIEISKRGSLFLETPQTRVIIGRNKIFQFYFGQV